MKLCDVCWELPRLMCTDSREPAILYISIEVLAIVLSDRW
jgi:hypothetical protein